VSQLTKHAYVRTEQEVYVWMTTSDMGFPVTQEREEVHCWCVEDRPVVFFLTSVITDCIRELQDEGKGPVTVTRVSKCVFLDLEVLDREWRRRAHRAPERWRNRALECVCLFATGLKKTKTEGKQCHDKTMKSKRSW
jgi:hypothetical protein